MTTVVVAPVQSHLHPISIKVMRKIDDSMIEIDGKVYVHDYDSDCYFRIHDPTTETFRERMIKIAVAIGLLVIIVISVKYF